MTNRTKDQQAAFDKLSKLKVGALFMDMGTGKTKTALDLMASKAHKCDYMLWICPCSIKHEIEAERTKWHPELTIDIVGVESIGQSDRIYMETRKKMEGKRCFAVVDESLKIKNITAKRTKRTLALGQLAEYKLILNGTPMSKNIMDIWAQMEFLSPKILCMSYREFKNCYTTYWTKGKLAGVVNGQVNVEHLISKIRPYIFDAELDIEPQKQYHTPDYYHMGMFEQMEYEEIKEQAFNEWMESGEEDMDVKGLFARLQAFYTQVENKAERLQQMIDEIDGKVVVFVKYLKSIPDGKLKIVGSMSQKEREETLRWFERGRDKELYITYGCGSFGLNLQFVKNVIFAEHNFDYATRIQAEARVYRIGQTEDVNYYELRCDCGMEDMILKNIWKKEDLLSEVRTEIERKGVEKWLSTI